MKQKDEVSKYIQYNRPGTIINVVDGQDLVKDDSAVKTIEYILAHKKSVKQKLEYLSKELAKRAEHHDDSKLEFPEIQWLIEMDREPRYPYGSPEYFDKQKRWQKFFSHHYKLNRHHPDHFPAGGLNMNLADLCEMACDVISYLQEMHMEQAAKAVDQQKERFGLDDQLAEVIKNTLVDYFSWFGPYKPTYLDEPDTQAPSEEEHV